MRLPRRTALLYLIVASLWILLSDMVLALFVSPQTHPQQYANLQSVKGWFFITLTAVILHSLLHSQLKRLDQEITTRQQTQQRLHTLLQAMPLAVIQLDKAGIVRYWNHPAEELYGWTAEETIGYPFPHTTAADKEAFDLLHQRVLAEENFISIDMMQHTKDGVALHANVSAAPMRDSNGNIVGVMKIVKDVGDRVATERRLRLQGAALNAAANGIVITDVNGNIQWVNNAFTKLTQYTREEALGRNPNELVRSGRQSQAFYQQLWDTILAGQLWHGEMINRRKDGTLYYEEQTITPLQDELGQITHFVGIKQDVTMRKQGEQTRYLLLALPNAIADAPSLESALEVSLSMVCAYADWDLGEVWVPKTDPESDNTVFLALLMQHYHDPHMDQAFRTFSQQFHFASGEGLPGQVWKSQDLIWVPDIMADEIFLRAEVAEELGFRVAMGLPILLDGTATAVMCFYAKTQRQKDEWLDSLMSGVAVQMAAAFQQKHYQEKLYQSQQLAQTTIDALNAHIAVLDENGVIIAVNQPWLDFGQTNGANMSRIGIGINYLNVCEMAADEGEEDAENMLAGIQKVMRGELREMIFEYPCPMPLEPRWFIARVTPLPGGDPKRCRVVISHEDVTGRKQAEETLRESEQHYRLLFDSNPQPMWVYDLETLYFLAVNDAAVEKYGFSRDEFLQMTLIDIRPPEDASRLLDDVAQPRPVLQHSGEWRHQVRDGRTIDVEVASHVISFNGRAAALVVAFDITERKQAAAERQAQTQRLQQILDTIPEGVVLLENTGQVVGANPLGEHLLLDLCGRGVGDRVTELNSLPISQILTLSRSSGYALQQGNRFFELMAQPITPETAVSDWVLLLRDVTAEHEQQQYIEAQNRLATVGQLAAGIAHDFNNVMAVIMLYTQMMQSMPELPPKASRYLETIVNQAQHAAKMISQILDFSRRSVMESAPIDLLPLVKELVKLLKNTLPETIEIELIHQQDEYTIVADPTRLQQALMNVAVNARDAMPQGGTLQFTLENLHIPTKQEAPLPDMAPGAWLQLTISDTGTGIAPEHLPHIFEPFYTTKEVGKGTGLGLAQLYGIIKQHKGSVDVVSTLGQGSSFIIYLPLFTTVAQPLPEPDVDLALLGGMETILLVEDNQAIRESIADALLSLGYYVLQAENGMAALTLLADEPRPIDLLLSDMVMPQMDGLALYQAVREKYPELKTLFMSGYPLHDREGFEFSELNWIEKPFSLGKLTSRLRAVLDE